VTSKGSKFVLSENIAKAWIGLSKKSEQGIDNENDEWKWINSKSDLTSEQVDMFEEPKMHYDKPNRECAEIKWHPKSIIEARKCTVPHADGVICQIP
jgi:hypothetical protein